MPIRPDRTTLKAGLAGAAVGATGEVVRETVQAKRAGEKVQLQPKKIATVAVATGTVFASNGEGTLSVVRQLDADRYAPALAVPTVKGARTMAHDPASRRVFLPAVIDNRFTMLVVAP